MSATQKDAIQKLMYRNKPDERLLTDYTSTGITQYGLLGQDSRVNFST